MQSLIKLISKLASSMSDVGHALAHLRFAPPKGIGPLIFEFEDLSEVRPGAVISEHAAHDDASLFQASMSFFYCAGATKIGGECGGSRQQTLGLEEHSNVLSQSLLMVLDRPEIVSFGLHNLDAQIALVKHGISTHYYPT